MEEKWTLKTKKQTLKKTKRQQELDVAQYQVADAKPFPLLRVDQTPLRVTPVLAETRREAHVITLETNMLN